MFGTAGELNKSISGILKGAENIFFDGISIDSRTIKKGEVFLALKGERFDGHEFVEDAIEKGAVGLIVDKNFNPKIKKGLFYIHVDDTKKALGQVANYWRKKISPKVIAITGSCGKTSTKEMIHALLSKKYKTLKNHANLNNYFGVSLTLLRLRNEEFAVVETGINHKGEMKGLAELIVPDGVLATNIAPVHLEGIPGLKEVFNEKRILLDSAKDVVFVNGDDRYLRSYLRNDVDIIKFGRKGDVQYKKVKILNERLMQLELIDERQNRQVVSFSYPGIRLAVNIAGAVAVARYFHIDWDCIIDGLKNVSLPKMRMEIVKIGNTSVIIDAYNSNFVAVKNALETFEKFKFNKKCLILGDMKELGKWSNYYHALLGKYLVKFNFHEIYFVGKEIKKTFDVFMRYGKKKVRYVETVYELKKNIKGILEKNDAVLVKGSRAIALEKLFEEETINAI